MIAAIQFVRCSLRCHGILLAKCPFVWALMLWVLSLNAARADIVWQEDFEGPTPGWTVETAPMGSIIWEIGIPISGPNAAHSADRVAATVLAGNYPDNATSKLISPSFVVPAGDQLPRLRFWHWWNFSSSDFGQVQISANHGATWTALSGSFTGDSMGRWSQAWFDLAPYAGKAIQVRFYFESHTTHYSSAGTGEGYAVTVGPGWYLDDLVVETGFLPALPNPQSDR